MALGLNATTGSEVLTLSGGTASMTIPSGCNTIVIFSVFGTTTASSTHASVSLTTNGSADITADLFYAEGATGAYPIAGYVWNTSITTGSDTLNMTQENAFTAGPVVAVYIDDASATLRDSDISHTGVTGTFDFTLTGLSVGDLVIGFGSNYDAVPPVYTGFANLQVLDQASWVDARASYKVATGSSETFGNTNEGDNPAIAAFVFAPVAVGGPKGALNHPINGPFGGPV